MDRNEFSRDRDRIIFSKAFRRLEHKAQVYSHLKGDHYRTRLTHTIEVMQIARSIARNLGLNEDLTEAIALGHDIGHTPFGHQGEEVLDNIMRGTDNLGGNLKYRINYYGFKHNFESIKVLDILEKKYEKEKGLNLTWQVIEGILKHTKTKKKGQKWDINRFIQCKKYIEKFLRYPDHSVTLEGQIVTIADEIAQRQHDLDDGLRDNDLKLDVNKIISYINEQIINIQNQLKKDTFNITDLDEKYYKQFSSYIKNSTPKDVLTKDMIIKYKLSEKRTIDYELWDKIVMDSFIVEYVVPDKIEIKLLRELETRIKKNKNCKNETYIWNSLIRDIIDYFIKDVTFNSLDKLKNDVKTHCKLQLVNLDYINCNKNNEIQSGNKKYWKKRKYFDSKIIDFSYSASEFDKNIESYIKNQILNSYNVNVFDGKAIYIVRQLFKAFYTNPRQMPKEQLNKLYQGIVETINLSNCNIILHGKKLEEIEFKTSPPMDINQLIKLLKLEFNKEELELIFKKTFPGNHLDLNYHFLKLIGGDYSSINKDCKKCDDQFNKKVIEKIFDKINIITVNDIPYEIEELQQQIIFIKCLLELHYVYLSIICDHIAGMTDNYANNEYKKLYLV
ncbi:dGTP triphosphohydrolase [Methanobacterium lacus]|uniref:dGTP triphosphohydrolase n=1 Tax=Methanobacterium lacus (strain AL-21) TaxID=877455 RepID=UPI0009FF3E00|nr:dNTP triphosphohydrolase [Methanobacterium lacus]